MADLGLPIDTVEETPQTNCDILPFYSEILFWFWWIGKYQLKTDEQCYHNLCVHFPV